MSMIVYIIRCILMLIITWLGIRIIGKKSIAQMTGYELAGILLLSTVAAEPLVYKIASKAFLGVLTLSFATLFLGWVSLKEKFYNVDSKPSIIIFKGQIIKEELRKNQMNLPFLMSMLRLKGYATLSEVECAVVEPNGNVSVIPKSQERPLKPKDLKVQTSYESLSVPLIIDGRVLWDNLNYTNHDEAWLMNQLKANGIQNIMDALIAELDSQGTLFVCKKEGKINQPKII